MYIRDDIRWRLICQRRGRWNDELVSPGDVARTAHWQGKDQQHCEQAFDRPIELLDLTIADERWKGRGKELARANCFLTEIRNT
jgi:hypothetical protein